MGFKLGRTYVLQFEGTGLEGAEVKLRSPSIGTLDKLLDEGTDRNGQYQIMLDHLIEWNLETADGDALPGTVEAIVSQMEPAVALLILKHWIRAARGVAAPLEPTFVDGGQSPAEESTVPSMPMETL